MFLRSNFYFQGIIMKIDQIVYVVGRGHIVCVRSFGEHVFKVGDKVTLTSSEEIGLEKTMFVTQISSIERMGMSVPYYLGLVIRTPDNKVNLSKYDELEY